jgi:Pre-mRNA splicing Prp18-interacting factor
MGRPWHALQQQSSHTPSCPAHVCVCATFTMFTTSCLVCAWCVARSCGSMSHKVADCLERPRAKGAKWTGRDIAADDKVQEINLVGYESKRDRYNGYDTGEYSRVVEQFEAVEALRSELKAREQVEALYANRGEADGDAANDGTAQAGMGGDDDKITQEEEGGACCVCPAVLSVCAALHHHVLL